MVDRHYKEAVEKTITCHGFFHVYYDAAILFPSFRVSSTRLTIKSSHVYCTFGLRQKYLSQKLFLIKKFQNIFFSGIYIVI